MAIAFNLPSERPAPAEECYSRLDSLLTELHDILCHMLITSQPVQPPPAQPCAVPPKPTCSPRCGRQFYHRGMDNAPSVRQLSQRGVDYRNQPSYHSKSDPTYAMNLVMVMAILNVSLASSLFNTIR